MAIVRPAADRLLAGIFAAVTAHHMKPFLRRPVPYWIMASVLIVSVMVLWTRNRDVLRDIFDYSVVIAAAGKVEQGFKPYADVRSPMQSSVYLLNYFTEQVFGRDYRGLTMGGLIQGLVGGLLLLALLRRPLGPWLASGLAMAVVMAGLMQHVVFFYNTIGIWCLGIVLLGLAAEPALWPVRSMRTAVLLAALFLSGINKINFHGVTLVGATLLTVASWRSGRIMLSGLGRNLLALVFFGGILPVAFELVWTGATYGQWLEQVVLGPTARHAFLTQIMTPAIYLTPAQDYYAHILVKGIGGIGLGLLVGTGGWLLLEAWAARRPVTDWLERGILIIFAAVAAGALMITNHETVLLTSLAYPLLATVFYVQYRESGRRTERWMRGILLAGMAVWVLTGAYAAWHGSRILYGQNPPPRESYVRLESPHRALDYFSGVRMLPEQIDALERTAARLETIEKSEGALQDMLFGAGQEWLERVYPQAIVRHAPIWLHAGTSLHDGDKQYFLGLLDNGRRRLLVQRGWEAWPPEISGLLAERYLAEHVGSRDVLYHPRGPRPRMTGPAEPVTPTSLEFRSALDSNVALTATRSSEGMILQDGREGGAWGGLGSTNWAWPLGSNALHGLAVARLAPNATKAATVTFRVMVNDAENGHLVWERSVAVGPDKPVHEIAFSLHAGGRPLWLQTSIPLGTEGLVFGGWRQLRITHSNEQDRSPPPAFSSGLHRIGTTPGTEQADELWYGPDVADAVAKEGILIPSENWRRAEPRLGVVRVTAALQRTVAWTGDPVSVTLAWYRAGRFEIMAERLVDPSNTTDVTLEGAVPEPGGWVGVLTRHGVGGDRLQITGWAH